MGGYYVDRLIGQPDAQVLLRQFVRAVSHSRTLLFHGPYSSGKSTAAKFLAADLIKDNRVLRDVHPDFVLLKEDNVGDIEFAREWKNSAYKAPFEAPRIVMVCHRIDRLSSEAANGMLKLFEEPPSAVTIIVTAVNLSGVLDTIQSRAMKVRFGPLSFENKIKILKERNVVVNLTERVVFSRTLAEAMYTDHYIERKQTFIEARRRVASIEGMSTEDLFRISDTLEPRMLAEYILAVDSRPRAIAAALECLGMLSSHVRPYNAALYLLSSLRSV